MDTTLHALIADRSVQLTHDHISHLVYQILSALYCLHLIENIIYRVSGYCSIIQYLFEDLKPANIGINRINDGRFLLKIFDFGLSRDNDTSQHMTQGVVTLYYRAPELLLNVSYGKGIQTIFDPINKRVLFIDSCRYLVVGLYIC